jgi:hypothetical protein
LLVVMKRFETAGTTIIVNANAALVLENGQRDAVINKLEERMEVRGQRLNECKRQGPKEPNRSCNSSTRVGLRNEVRTIKFAYIR